MKNTIITGLFIFVLFASGFAQSLQEARKLTENEQFEDATGMFKTLISLNPSDPNLYYFYGDNLLLSDNSDSAKIVFDKGFVVNPASPLIKIGKAKILLDDINLREAKSSSEKDGANPELRDRYEQAGNNVKSANALLDEATLNSNDLTTLIEAAEALIHYKNKDTDKAKLFLDRASLIDPKNIEINLLNGDLYTELNNGTLAADYYNRALDLNKASARAIVSKGRLYKRSTNYEGASREFLNAISIDNSYAPAHRELGETYIKLGSLSKAKEEYRKYLELSKNNCGARIRYASFLYIGKNYSDALAELDQVQVKCDSNNLTLLRVQSYCYYETKDTAKGLLAVRHLFRLLPPEKRTATDLEYYGKLLIMNGQDSSGIGQLQKAFSLESARTDLLFEIASAWSKLRQYPNAIEVLKQKIAIGKDGKGAAADYYILARAYYYNRQFIEADSAAARVNEMSSNYASGWLLRAQINSNIDSTSEAGLAKPFYEKYIEIALNDSTNIARYRNGVIEAYGYLAYYYIIQKDKQNGLLYLKKKLEFPLEPEDKKRVLQAIDQLEGRSPQGKSK